MNYFNHNGIDFCYGDRGFGAPFCMLHSLGRKRQEPEALFEGVSGIRLITMDFRGHGRSHYAGPPSAYHIPIFADDVIALLDHLGIRRAVIGGVSLGAAVAVNLAARYPERVRALVLVRPAWLNRPSPDNLGLLVRLGRAIERHGVDGAREQLVGMRDYRAIKRTNPRCADDLLALLRRPQAADTYEALKRLPISIPFWDWSELEAIQQPALVAANRKDWLHPFEFGQSLAAHLPQGQLEEVYPHYIHPDKHRRSLQRIVQRFAGQLEQAGPAANAWRSERLRPQASSRS